MRNLARNLMDKYKGSPKTFRGYNKEASVNGLERHYFSGKGSITSNDLEVFLKNIVQVRDLVTEHLWNVSSM